MHRALLPLALLVTFLVACLPPQDSDGSGGSGGSSGGSVGGGIGGNVGDGGSGVGGGVGGGTGGMDGGGGGGVGGGAGGAGGMDAGTDAGPLTNACLNDTDLTVLNNSANDMQQIGTDCGFGCIESVDAWTCNRDCYVTSTAQTGMAMTGDCAACHADLNVCVTTTCATACFAGPSDPTCVSCMCSACEPDYVTCAGFGLPQCAP